eukprot:4129724-Prymnesium_polylepis.2
MRNLPISRRSLEFDDVCCSNTLDGGRRGSHGRAAATLPGPAAERAAASNGRRRRQPAAHLTGSAQAQGVAAPPPVRPAPLSQRVRPALTCCREPLPYHCP